MNTTNKREIQIARRQKRLHFWRSRFSDSRVPVATSEIIKDLLNTYNLLTSKLANAKTDDEINESENRLVDLERQLVALFEAFRQTPSSVAPRSY